ncbi:MAG: LPS export ABC transporter permease LptG [Deltaproteobacteria bacterium]|nr:LPS export ABC transporter permease LptG [Deltaproteobacteria bacterium]
MKTLSKYVAREYIKVLLICFSAVTTVYLLVHFLGKLDEFIEFKASLSLILRMMLLKIPRIFYEVLPIVSLLSTLITLSLLSRHNEIIAMRSCGIHLSKLLMPILFVTFLLSMMALADGEWLVPYANQRLSWLDDVALKKKPHLLALKNNRIWFRTGAHGFCNIRKVDPDRRILHNVTLYDFDNDFKLRHRLDAQVVIWKNSGWITRKGTEWIFSGAGEILKERAFHGAFPLKEPLKEIIKVEKPSGAMGYKELRTYITLLKKDGYPTAGYEVDLYAKISYTMISFIMVLLGIPFALHTNRKGGLAFSIGISLVVGFIYWLAFSVGLSFGHGSLMPPLLAAWIANLFFGTAAGYRLARVRF